MAIGKKENSPKVTNLCGKQNQNRPDDPEKRQRRLPKNQEAVLREAALGSMNDL
jgi:hypothetical protein